MIINKNKYNYEAIKIIIGHNAGLGVHVRGVG